MYQNVTEGNFRFFDRNVLNSSEIHYLESGFYPSSMDTVEAMNPLTQERHKHSETSITVEVSLSSQKVEIYLINEECGLAFFSGDLGHIFRTIVGTKFGVMLRRKGTHKPKFTYDIVCIHSLMIYMDLIEYKIVGDTKAPLLRCFIFVSKLKAVDIITTGQ